MQFQVSDTVALCRGVPDEGLPEGAIGAVILVFDKPERAYEVEFCDDDGRTVAQVVLAGVDLRLVEAAGG